MARKKQINTTQIQKAVEEAEKIVSGVKDDSLRPIAYREVLGVLLTGQIPGGKKGIGKQKREPKSDTQVSRTPKGKGPKGLIKKLKEEGFFENSKNSREILTKLETRGHHYGYSDLTRPLRDLVRKEVLRREKRKPAEGKKEVWFYSNY